jgi:hypothetical protein
MKITGYISTDEDFLDDYGDLITSKREWVDIIRNAIDAGDNPQLAKKVKVKITDYDHEIDEGRPRSSADVIFVGKKEEIDALIKSLSEWNIGFGTYS